MTDSNYRPEPDVCERCDGFGVLAETLNAHTCDDPSVFPCPECEGAGTVEHPRQEQP